MKLIEITALCRSGHHAVLNWIVRSITGQQCTWSYKMNLMDNGFRILSEANHDIPLSYKFIEEHIPTTEFLVVGYEDTPWNFTLFSNDKIFRGPLSLNIASSYGFNYQSKIVVIRDFYSNLASRIKSNEEKHMKNWNDGSPHLFAVGQDYINRWKNLAKSCLEDKVSYIKFEDWLSNKQVRKEFLQHNFGVKDMYGIVEIIGTTSAFDDKKHVKDRTGQVEIPENIKELIRKDSELHYLIGALGYEYKQI